METLREFGRQASCSRWFAGDQHFARACGSYVAPGAKNSWIELYGGGNGHELVFCPVRISDHIDTDT